MFGLKNELMREVAASRNTTSTPFPALSVVGSAAAAPDQNKAVLTRAISGVKVFSSYSLNRTEKRRKEIRLHLNDHEQFWALFDVVEIIFRFFA